jgi:hypothetical protein
MAGGMFGGGGRKPPARPMPQQAKMPAMGAAGPGNKYATALGGFGEQAKGGVPNLSQAYGAARGAMPNASPAGQMGAAMGMRQAAATPPGVAPPTAGQALGGLANAFGGRPAPAGAVNPDAARARAAAMQAQLRAQQVRGG